MGEILNTLGKNFGLPALSILVLAGIWKALSWLITNRVEKAVQHEYDKKLAGYQADLKSKSDKMLARLQAQYDAELELLKIAAAPYLRQQFDVYNRLWVTLYHIKEGAIGFDYETAFSSEAGNLISEIVNAKFVIEESALLLEPTHYTSLSELLKDMSTLVEEVMLAAQEDISNGGPGESRAKDVERWKDIERRIETTFPEIQKSLREQISGRFIHKHRRGGEETTEPK